ncbi:MAG: hypothetical protein WAU56_04910 [Steroidobacteraceae bacterium]
MASKIKISKLDAARRQLECAIRLWTNDDDSVSIHTLAFSALAIIEDINLKKGNKEHTLLGTMQLIVKPEYVNEAMGQFKQAMTFFKHANRDPHAILEFDPTLSNMVIRFGISGLHHLGERIDSFQHAFLLWDTFNDPKALHVFQKQLGQSLSTEHLDQLRRLNKRQFMETVTPILSRTRR